MGERISGFVPFGEFKPDLRYLANDGLLWAKNVVPVYGSYISSPTIYRISVEISASNVVAHGLHVDKLSGNGYFQCGSDIWEITDAGVVTNRTRTAPGNYLGVDFGATGASFGDLNIICMWDEGIAPEPVQYLVPGAARFANMITSTFEPRGRYAFGIRGNLFLAHCYLAGAYDTLATGYNKTLLAWSRNEDIRQFGSPNVDPQIIGAGYQPLNFDLGEITGAISGADCGIVAFPNGIVRVDGPPYSFRVIARTAGTVYPYSLAAADRDIYFLGPAGLTRLNGGEGPGEVIGLRKFARSLLDYSTTGFSTMAIATASGGSTVNLPDLSCAYDAVNNLLFMSYRASEGDGHSVIAAYNISEDRLSIFLLRTAPSGIETGQNAIFLRPGRSSGQDWLPGRDIRFINTTAGSGTGGKFYSRFSQAPSLGLGDNAAAPVMQKGYMQLKSDATTRVLRIRPIYHVSDQSAIEHVSVLIDSTNKPYATPLTTGPYSSPDAHGWIVTPDSVFSDFMSPRFTIASNPALKNIVEYEGFEYEAEVGGRYAA